MTKHSTLRTKMHSNCLKCIELRILGRFPKPEKRYSRLAAKCSLEQYNQMFEEQKGLCLGCYKHQTELGRGLFVDHCHATQKIRGLLCQRCNSALGLIQDNSASLRRLADYIDKSKQIQ